MAAQKDAFVKPCFELLRKKSSYPLISEGRRICQLNLLTLAKTADLCIFTEANVLIMDVTAYTPWKLEERMKIRGEVKAQNPGCKIVLVVDENTEKKLADKVRQAKKDGLIDNFIYGSVSSTYLSAVIDTL